MSVMLLLVTLMLTVPTLSALFSVTALQDILGMVSVVQVCHSNCYIQLPWQKEYHSFVPYVLTTSPHLLNLMIVCPLLMLCVFADIDECAIATLNDCDVNAACSDTEGSFNCTCLHGYQGDGVACSKLCCRILHAHHVKI